MNKTRKPQVSVHDRATGGELLTIQQVADYLHYHPVSIRRLVSQGGLRPYSVSGKAHVFRKVDIERFRYSSPWASRKSKIKYFPNPPLPEHSPQQMKAVVVLGTKERVVKELRAFQWKEIPLIRAKVEHEFGGEPFTIAVQGPDGSGWEVSFRKNYLEIPNHDLLNSSRNRKKDFWLIN